MFNYGGFKLFLFKFITGLCLISFSFFLIISVITHNPNDPGIGKFGVSADLSNIFGFYGALASSILIFLMGKLSLLILSFIFYEGIRITLGVKIKLFLLKFTMVLISVLLFGVAIMFINTKIMHPGYLATLLIDIISYYSVNLESDFIYKHSIGVLLFLLASSILIFSFSIRLLFLKNIFQKI